MAKAKRKHLKEIRTVQAADGSYVHHHTYQTDADDPHSAEPERQNVATSESPDEAGQHVSDQFAMNQPQGDPSQAPSPDEVDPSTDPAGAPTA